MKTSPVQTYLIYARVSPKGSAWTGQETSIPVQVKECKDYVLRRDPSARFVEIYDEFKSGKNLHRDGMKHIIAQIEQGADWDCIVVWSLDRLTRSLVDALPLLEKIRDNGKGLMSVRQSIDMFSAGGRLQLHMMICFAEYERSMLSERVGASMRNIARSGKIPFGSIPFGYRRKEKARNTLEVVADEAEIVRHIFRCFLADQLRFEEINSLCPGKIRSRQVLYSILSTAPRK